MDQEKSRTESQFVTFSLAGEYYAQEISRIHEINKVASITKIPHTPRFILGVVNLRGKIIPVIDMRKLLGLPPMGETREQRIIVMDVLEEVVGLVVDSVHQVITVPDTQLLESPHVLQNVDEEFIKAVAKVDERLIIFLDVDGLISARGLSCAVGNRKAPDLTATDAEPK